MIDTIKIDTIWPGKPHPRGSTWDGHGVNFALFSEHAQSVELCLFDVRGRESQRIALRERTEHVWHCYLPQARPGLAYGYRVHGPYAPQDGHRFNPNKLVVDPYAKDFVGRLRWSVEDSLAGHDACVAEIRRRVPGAKLLVLSVLPSDRGDWTTQATRGMNQGLAQRYTGGKVAGISYADATPLFEQNGAIDRSQYYDKLRHPPEPAIHPTAQAHAKLAALIEPDVAKI